MMSTALQLSQRLDAFAVFQAECKRIWRNADAVPLELSTEEPKGGAWASVAVTGRPRAIGNHVLNPENTRTLRVSHKALALPPEALRRILIHEACHLGIGGHGEAFKALCRASGGAVYVAEADGSPARVEVQLRPRGRFQLARSFPLESLAEARAWMTAEWKRTHLRYRLVY